MALTFLQVAQQQLATTDSTLHTCPSGTVEVLRQVVVCNASGVDRKVNVAIVAPGGSPSGANRILDGMPVKAHDTLTFDLFQAIPPSGTIAASADAAGALTLTATAMKL